MNPSRGLSSYTSNYSRSERKQPRRQQTSPPRGVCESLDQSFILEHRSHKPPALTSECSSHAAVHQPSSPHLLLAAPVPQDLYCYSQSLPGIINSYNFSENAPVSLFMQIPEGVAFRPASPWRQTCQENKQVQKTKQSLLKYLSDAQRKALDRQMSR